MEQGFERRELYETTVGTGDGHNSSMPTAQLDNLAANNVTAMVQPWNQFIFSSDNRFAWDQLSGQATEPNPFCERWYLQSALEALDKDFTVRIATIWSGEQILGLVPLYRSTKYGGLPLHSWQNWLNHNAFLGTPLVREGWEKCFWDNLLFELDGTPEQSLFAHFTGIHVDGVLAKALVQSSSRKDRRVELVHREERALLEGGLTPEAYLEANLRGKKRKELRRQQNRLSEIGQLKFQRTDGQRGLESWIDEFLELEKRGWKGANGSALACAPETEALFRNALAGAADQSKLELLALRLDGRAIAMLVNFLTPPGSFSFKTAFDEDYARYSPGVLLQIENLKLLERSDILWCDSCAAQDHPMIDSIWSGRRTIGRYSVAIGGTARRSAFAMLLAAEKAKGRLRQINAGKAHKSNEKTR